MRNTSLRVKTLTSEGGTDVFLAKYGRSGKLQWLIEAGGPGDDERQRSRLRRGRERLCDGRVHRVRDVSWDQRYRKDGDGAGANDIPGEVRAIGRTRLGANRDCVSTGATNVGFGVAVEPVTGSIYMTGMSQVDTTFSSSNGTTHSVAGPGTWHMVLVKYDTAGNFQWGQSNQAAPNSISHKVAVDAHDNAYVTGWMEGRNDLSQQ